METMKKEHDNEMKREPWFQITTGDVAISTNMLQIKTSLSCNMNWEMGTMDREPNVKNGVTRYRNQHGTKHSAQVRVSYGYIV